jgi:hypothetical protein
MKKTAFAAIILRRLIPYLTTARHRGFEIYIQNFAAGFTVARRKMGPMPKKRDRDRPSGALGVTLWLTVSRKNGHLDARHCLKRI